MLIQILCSLINELIEYHRTTSVNRGQNLLLKDMNSEQTSSNANKDPPRIMQNPQPQTSNQGQTFVAAYDFQPQEEGEIELKRGDRIRMLDQSDVNWWKGEVRGHVGLFPATYVRPL